MVRADDFHAGVVVEIGDQILLYGEFALGHDVEGAGDCFVRWEIILITIGDGIVIEGGDEFEVITESEEACAGLVGHSAGLEFVGDFIFGDEEVVGAC